MIIVFKTRIRQSYPSWNKKNEYGKDRNAVIKKTQIRI
jgi:hypothetical protein